jgi:two-component system response regulator HydG
MAKAHILVVEDDVEMLSLLHDELGEAGFDVHALPSAREALEHVRVHAVDAVVTDLVMPGMRGDELLRQLRAAAPGVPVVIMTAFGSIESAVEAMREGAYHYITKPFRIEQLIVTLENALAENRLRQDLLDLAGIARDRAGIVAESLVMRRTMDLVTRAAPADTPVLILGESGTGKELLARALHAAGPRRDRSFIAVNCSAIPETLLESQLFGHRRGAFTDAREDRRGLFQEAEGGTILLDEIGDMALSLQTKLLRVLQEKEVHPLGAAAPVAVDVRVIAATNRDLEAMCAQGRFRQDLYYRLNVMQIRLPPLCERSEDIPLLVQHFIRRFRQITGKPIEGITDDALALLLHYPFPGNIRELENIVERAFILCQGSQVTVDHLPNALVEQSIDQHRRAGMAVSGLSRIQLDPLERAECRTIQEALRQQDGNRSRAALALGIHRSTLIRKLKHYGIR